jgi:translation initiation factor IF-2
MAKIRVGQLAKELGIKVTEALKRLQELGVEVKTNLSTVEESSAARLREALASGRPAAEATGTPAKGSRPRLKPADAAHGGAKTSPPESKTSQRAAPATPKTPTSAGTQRTPAAAAARTVTPRGETHPTSLTAQPPVPPGKGGVRPTSQAAPVQGVTRPGQKGAPARATSSVVPGRLQARVTGPGPAPRTAPTTPQGRTSASAPRPGMARPATPAAGRVAPGGVTHPRPAPKPTPGGTPAAGAPKLRPVGTSAAAPARQAHPTSPTRSAPPAMTARGGTVPPNRVAPPPPPPVPEVLKQVSITEGVTVKELSEKLNHKAKDIITKLMSKGLLATINQPLDTSIATEVCREFGYEATVISFEQEAQRTEADTTAPADLRPRDPVVTIMGHVDHGKTSLLDAIRASNIVASEAGGITQHIGAYHIRHKNRGIAFIDTPGHEAFTLMRARGAKVTDVVVLVVAADDGVMPQTVEAIDHARAANVPLIVAINKIDKPGANLDRVKKQLSDHGLLVEDWGGQVVAVPISAKAKLGIEELLEMVLLVADLGDLKADPTARAAGTVLESRLDRARGPVATILVQGGTLRIGDPFIAGAVHGKVRAMFDDLGHRVQEAGPSIPVEVLGLEGVPKAGDPFQVLEEEWKVRQIGAFRQQKLRQEAMAKSSRLTLDHLHQQISEGTVKELPLVVKADVQGSVEALTNTLMDLPSDKVKIKIIHTGSGGISETDVLLASASNAIIIGYNVRPDRSAQELAEKERVDIRLHSVIYDISNEIKNAMVGMLEPESKEVYLGRAEVRQVFKVPKVGSVAGCMVSDGRVTRSAEVRLLRDNVVVFTGRIASLKRFKDDASEVKAGYECGIGLANYNDVKVGDVIEAFKVEKVAVKSL